MKKIVAAVTALTICLGSSVAFAADRETLLKEGDKDQIVYDVQKQLTQGGYFNTNPTGYFGSITKDAVTAFQAEANLTQDGIVGPETIEALMGSQLSYIRYIDRNQIYQNGTSSLSVGAIQRRLMELDYHEFETFTSYYGTVTQEAIQAFQRVNGIQVDGIAGPETLALLISDDAKSYCVYPGQQGDDIKRLQMRLEELNYYHGSIDGIYGSSTESAVKAFQKNNDLEIDGIIGANTLDVLYTPNANLAPEESSSSEKKESASEKKESSSTQSEEKQKESSSNGESSGVSAMISFAKDQLGKKYKWSTEGPNSFDCSGFVYYVLKNSGISTGRYSAAGFSQVSEWDKISKKSNLQPGDLVFFTKPGSSSIGHVGIWLGDNTYIHASTSAGKVVISDAGSYFNDNFVFGRRVFA